MKSFLNVNSSPHLKHPDTTNSIMLDVIIALLPACAFGCILFGLRAAAMLLVCVGSAIISEFLWNKILKKSNTLGDLSAVVTGLLLAMNLPSKTPLWMAAIGSVIAIIVVKQMFGGLGCNFANPAITARIVMLVSFPSAMSNYELDFIDTTTSATPLTYLSTAADKIPHEISLTNMFFGLEGGCIGETSSFLLIIGGLYLILRRVITPTIPLSYIATVALLTFVFGDNVSIAVFGGGLMLGAIFMATDYTTSPTTELGKLIFGIGCGLITFVIRKFAALPEGVSYAILIMNILVPYINRISLKKPFGFITPKKEAKSVE
ncbi:MAG: RnfABCDGE type electron transport complex subunit D [Ruminococcaceae bacterium]|nr:RnfABCDGE type electron transport complex subunit D [Oscillospiraceae bacterium]